MKNTDASTGKHRNSLNQNKSKHVEHGKYHGKYQNKHGDGAMGNSNLANFRMNQTAGNMMTIDDSGKYLISVRTSSLNVKLLTTVVRERNTPYA